MRRALVAPLVVAALGAVLLAADFAVNAHRALFTYAAAFDFVVTTALGSLVFVMINHTARSRWYVVLRRLNEAAAPTLPLLALLFVPVALGTRALFPWTHPLDYEAHVQRAYHDAGHWYTSSFFVARAYVYLVVWALIAFVLRRQSLAQDRDGRVARTNVQRWVSSAGTPVMAITLTLAAFDWFMSIVPGWSSTMHGLYVFAASFSGAMGLTVVAAWLARRAALLPPAVGPYHFLALGRVLLVAVILWGYIAFCTLLLVWIADIPREVTFYLERTAGPWAYISGFLLFGHFVIPFLLLLSRALKLRPALLAMVGAWVLAFHALDVYWLIVPSSDAHPSVLDAGAFLLVGGVVFAFGAWRFLAVRTVPIRDPNLAPSLRYVSP